MQFHLLRAFVNGTDVIGVHACSFISSGHSLTGLMSSESMHAVSAPSIRQWDGRVLENWVNIYDGSRFVYGKCGIFVM